MWQQGDRTPSRLLPGPAYCFGRRIPIDRIGRRDHNCSGWRRDEPSRSSSRRRNGWNGLRTGRIPAMPVPHGRPSTVRRSGCFHVRAAEFVEQQRRRFVRRLIQMAAVPRQGEIPSRGRIAASAARSVPARPPASRHDVPDAEQYAERRPLARPRKISSLRPVAVQTPCSRAGACQFDPGSSSVVVSLDRLECVLSATGEFSALDKRSRHCGCIANQSCQR